MTTLGEKRYESDTRQLGGLLLTFGALITMNSLTGIAGIVAGPDSTPQSGKALYDLIATLCLSLVGIMGVLMGFVALVHDDGSKMWSLSSCFLTQLAWLPFMGNLVGVGMAAGQEGSFIDSVLYNPTTGDVKFVGAMGILSILAYASAFVGSLSFAQFGLYAYQSGGATTKYVAAYYRGRLGYYSAVVWVAGFAQLTLGSFVLAKFGNGPLPMPIGAGPIVVTFPELSIFVGVLQLIVGMLGLARRMGWICDSHVPTKMFGYLCLTLWLSMLTMQIMVQVGYPAGPEMVPMAPTLGCLYFALPLMPAYLDYKTNTVPEELDEDYFGTRGAAAELETREGEKQLSGSDEEEEKGKEKEMVAEGEGEADVTMEKAV